MRFTRLIACFVLMSTYAQASQHVLSESHSPSSQDVRNALKDGSIIPTVLDDFTPSYALSVAYPDSHASVDLGNDLEPSDVGEAPVFTIKEFGSAPGGLSPTRTLPSNKTLILILTDPDATSRANPTKGQMCHWIATGIEISTFATTTGSVSEHRLNGQEVESKIRTGVDELMPYFAPAPPPKTGKHRYIFVVLVSENDGQGKELSKPKSRPHWGYKKQGKGVREWAKENNLTAVGANFFYAQHKKQRRLQED